MNIHIENLTVDAIIGILDFEREKPQRIIVNLELNYEFKESNFINYALVSELISMKLKTEKYMLLEEALLDIKKHIVTSYPQIKKLALKISKPDILPNCIAGLSEEWSF